MRGKESQKKSKKEKTDGTSVKVQSEYQKDKTRKSIPDLIVSKPRI